MKLASIDLGTNSFRLLIANISNSNLEFIFKESKITGLGKGFNNTKRLLSTNSILNSLEVLKYYSKILNNYDIKTIKAVATSAVREASNANEFLVPANKILNTEIDVISGNREAELTTLGVLHSIDKIKGYKLVVDIGGGSTEFGLCDRSDDIVSVCSLNLGVVSIAEIYNIDNKVPKVLIDKITTHIKTILISELKLYPIITNDIKEIIVTAGTPTTLAAIDLGLEKYDPKKVTGYRLTKDNITKILRHICSLDAIQRLKIKGLFSGRETLIIPGTLIALELMHIANINRMIVSDGGLLEGIIYNETNKLCHDLMQL